MYFHASSISNFPLLYSLGTCQLLGCVLAPLTVASCFWNYIPGSFNLAFGTCTALSRRLDQNDERLHAASLACCADSRSGPSTPQSRKPLCRCCKKHGTPGRTTSLSALSTYTSQWANFKMHHLQNKPNENPGWVLRYQQEVWESGNKACIEIQEDWRSFLIKF